VKQNCFDKITSKPKNYISMQSAKLGLINQNNNQNNHNNKFICPSKYQDVKRDNYSSMLIKEENKKKSKSPTVSSYKNFHYGQNNPKNVRSFAKENQLDRSHFSKNEVSLNVNFRSQFTNNDSYINKYKIKNGNPNNIYNENAAAINKKTIKSSIDSQQKSEKTYAEMGCDSSQIETIKRNSINNSLNNKLKNLFKQDSEGKMMNFSFDDFSIENKKFKYENYIKQKEKLKSQLQDIFLKEKFFMHKINESRKRTLFYIYLYI